MRLLTRGPAERFFGVWRSRRLHHRTGRRRKVTWLRVPYIRRPRISQRSNDPGTSPRRKSRPCTAHLNISTKKSLTSPCSPQINHKRDSGQGAPAQHAVFRWRIGTAFDGGFNAGLLFQIWKDSVVDATVMVDHETGWSKGIWLCYI